MTRIYSHSTSLLIPQQSEAPYFETTIRYIGGLLSAYALSGLPGSASTTKHGESRALLLHRVEELVRKLDPVFNTPSGMPYPSVDPGTWVPLSLAVMAHLIDYTNAIAEVTPEEAIQSWQRSARCNWNTATSPR